MHSYLNSVDSDKHIIINKMKSSYKTDNLDVHDSSFVLNTVNELKSTQESTNIYQGSPIAMHDDLSCSYTDISHSNFTLQRMPLNRRISCSGFLVPYIYA